MLLFTIISWVLVLDRSGSINDGDKKITDGKPFYTWRMIKGMVDDVIDLIPMSPDGTHMALVSFSSDVTTDVPLTITNPVILLCSRVQ